MLLGASLQAPESILSAEVAGARSPAVRLTRAGGFPILNFLLRRGVSRAFPVLLLLDSEQAKGGLNEGIAGRRAWKTNLMTEATCRREIELEIPADKVRRRRTKVARDIVQRRPNSGISPGQSADDAGAAAVCGRHSGRSGAVARARIPGKGARREETLIPVTRPEVDKVEFKDGEPLKFRAVFEVLPEFELGDYKNIQVEVDEIEAGDAEVEKAIEEMRERAATFVPVEGRAAKDGDSVLIKLNGVPTEGGEPVEADNIMVPLGAEETLASFTENLRGASAGETKTIQARYPDDYPDQKLAGKTYDFTVEVQGIKEKKLPELNDEFVKEVAGEKAEVTTLDELREENPRKHLEASKEQQQGRRLATEFLSSSSASTTSPCPKR